MSGIEYEVNPMWKFLRDNFGFAEAFTFFGPYAGANIKVRVIDQYTVESSMDLVLTNTNYVGTHFGGSLYSMCDPFYMFLLMQNLGPEYIVWDKSASIDFLRPGKGLVKATFHVSAEEIDRIRAVVKEKRKMDWSTDCEILDQEGKQIARLHKVIYVRRGMR
ncbi:MAG: YiiD C-terminal domain-containing protein [Leptospirales bacterium]|nr:YiiD C-terminal domain-containing protein [Leptospirales bacterium]